MSASIQVMHRCSDHGLHRCDECGDEIDGQLYTREMETNEDGSKTHRLFHRACWTAKTGHPC